MNKRIVVTISLEGLAPFFNHKDSWTQVAPFIFAFSLKYNTAQLKIQTNMPKPQKTSHHFNSTNKNYIFLNICTGKTSR